jgi:hypothetical protein
MVGSTLDMYEKQFQEIKKVLVVLMNRELQLGLQTRNHATRFSMFFSSSKKKCRSFCCRSLPMFRSAGISSNTKKKGFLKKFIGDTKSKGPKF